MRPSTSISLFLTSLLLLAGNAYGQNKTTTQRETMRIPEVQSGGSLGINIQGAGVPIGVFEAPVTGSQFTVSTTGDLSHVTAVDAGDVSSHATTVVQILTSQGVVSPANLGVAPQASVYVYQREWQHEAWAIDMASAISTYNLLLSNHSYAENNGWSGSATWQGVIDMSDTEDYKFGYYGDHSRTMDSIMHYYPYHLCVKAIANDRGDTNTGTPFNVYSSASFNVVSRSSPRPEPDGGSDGYDGLGRDATSKNALVIGAVNNISGGYSAFGDISFANSKSGWGLTDDGRIKPDLVGPGQLTTGTAYTSYAAPMITGLGALLQELNRSQNGRWLKSASLKGLLIHTADAGTSNGAPLASMGWGLPNAESAASFLLNSDGNQRLIEAELENGETMSFRFYHDGTTNFRATLVWTDPHGTSPTLDFTSGDLDDSTPMLVNDLDMELWEESGPSLLASPWKLDVTNPSNAATTGDNNVDNVERIDLASASMAAGWYTLRISHDGTLSDPQAFSLLISDAQGETFSGGLWSNAPSTWSSGVLVRITDTVNTAHIRSSATVSFLEMEAGADLHVHHPNTLTISGELLLKANSTSTAMVKGTVVGQVQRQSYLSGSAGWRYLWSPLKGLVGDWSDELTRVHLSGSSSPSLYTWNPSTTQWVALAASDSLQNKALALYMGTNAYAQFSQLPFVKSTKGYPVDAQQVHVLTVDDDLDSSDDDLGWNKIGHPYLAPVDWQLLDVSQTGGSFYIWNNAESDFAVSDGTNFTLGGRRYIYPGQSFWVYASSTSTGNFTMDSAAVVLTTDEPLLKSKLPSVRVTQYMSNGMRESAIVVLDPNATENFDLGMDTPNREGADPNRGSLTWRSDAQPLVISKVPPRSGRTTLSVGPSTYGLDSVSIELQNAELYSFTWWVDSTTYPIHQVPMTLWSQGGEFDLVWSSTLDHPSIENLQGEFLVYDSLVQWTGEESIRVRVMDASGRILSHLYFEAGERKSIELPPGAYTLISEDGHILKWVQ